MVKIKKGDLFGARDIITNKMWMENYTIMPMQKMYAIKMAESLLELVKASNDLTDRRTGLLNQYGKKNKFGKVIIEPIKNDPDGKGEYKLENKEAFDKGIKELFDEEIEVIGFDYEWLRGMQICPAEFNAISFLLI